MEKAGACGRGRLFRPSSIVCRLVRFRTLQPRKQEGALSAGWLKQMKGWVMVMKAKVHCLESDEVDAPASQRPAGSQSSAHARAWEWILLAALAHAREWGDGSC